MKEAENLPDEYSFLWTSIKIKISMNFVSKEYEIKMKMVYERWLQLKMQF